MNQKDLNVDDDPATDHENAPGTPKPCEGRKERENVERGAKGMSEGAPLALLVFATMFA